MRPPELTLIAALLAIVCAEGTRVEPRDLAAVWRRPSVLVRGLLAVVVAVPFAALLAVRWLEPSRRVAIGLAVLSAAPLAPIILKRIAKSGEDFRVGAGLHVVLAALSAFTAPLVIASLGRALDFHGTAPPLAIARSVFVTTLLPFGVGVALNTLAPRTAGRVRGPLSTLGTAVLLTAFVALAVVERRLFLALGVRDYAAMVTFCVLAVASGHLLAVNDDERTTFALESAARNPGLALLIATSSFGPVKAVPVLLPYLVVYVVVSSLYVRIRQSARAPRVSTA